MQKHLFLLLFSAFYISNIAIAETSTSDYEKAIISFNNEEFDSAFIHVRNALAKNPDNLPSKILVAKIFLENRLYSEAQTEFEEAFAMNADVNLFVEPWLEVLQAQKRYNDILTLPLDAKLLPNNRALWLASKGEACIATQDLLCATAYFTQLSKSQQNQNLGLNGLAKIALIQKNYSGALAHLDSADSKQAEYAETLRLKGQISGLQGAYSDAIDYFKQSLERDSSSAMTIRNLADAYIASGDFDSALNVANSILEQNPNDPFVTFTVAWLSSQNEDKVMDIEALDELKTKLVNLEDEAIDADPIFTYLRGLTYFVEGNYENALVDFTSYHAKFPEHIMAAVLLSKTHVNLGNYKAALSALEKHEEELITVLSEAFYLGDLYLRNFNQYKAVNILERIKKQSPDSPYVALFEVKVLLSRKLNTQAAEKLEALYHAYPNIEEIAQSYVLVQLQLNQLTKAEKGLAQFAEDFPYAPGINDLQIGLYLKQKQYAQAIDTIDTVITQRGRLRSLLYNKALALHETGQYQASFVLLQEVLNKTPAHEPSLQLLGEHYIATNNNESAYKVFADLLRKNENNVDALTGKINTFLLEKDYQSALRELNKLAKQYPLNAQYPLQKAKIYLTTKDNDGAKRETNKLRFLAQSNPKLYWAISRLYLAQQDIDNALAVLQELRTLAPNELRINIEIITLLMETQQFEQAQNLVLAMKKRYPNNSSIALKYAQLAEKQGQFMLANERYLAVLSLDEKNDVALAKMYGLTLKGVPKNDFLDMAARLIEKEPTRYYPRSLLAQYHFYYGDQQEALLHYVFLLEHNLAPNVAALQNRIAIIYLPMDLDKSESYASSAYAADNNKSNIANTYAWVLAKKGHYAKSLDILRKVYVTDSVSPMVQYRLAFVLHKLGNNKEAISLVDKALQSNRDFSHKAEAIALKSVLSSK